MTFSSRLRAWPVAAGLAMILAAVLLGLSVQAGIIREEDLEVLDEFIEHRTSWLTTFMIFVTNAFSPVSAAMMGLVAGGAAWAATRRLATGAYIWLTVGTASAITFVLKIVFHRQRPPELTRLVSEADFGYPSGHTTGAAALAFSVALVIAVHRSHPRRAVIALTCAAAFTALIAATRLYLGVHWFTDTFAGAFIGIGTALLLAPLVLSWTGRRHRAGDRL